VLKQDSSFGTEVLGLADDLLPVIMLVGRVFCPAYRLLSVYVRK
jgi:hypothetical protein